MESTSRATAAGVFVVIMMMMIIGVLFWFSLDKKADRIEYDIFTSSSVDGLLPQASVELHGINVGTVQSISFAQDQPGLIQIRMLIDRNAPITQATYAMLHSRGVTGAPFVDLTIDLEAPSEKKAQLLAQTDDSEIPKIPLKPTVLQTFTHNANSLLKQLDETLVRLNYWLSPENSNALFSAVENVGNAANQITKLGETLDIKANQVFTDVSLSLKDISALVKSTNQLATSLNAPGGTIQKMNSSMQSLSKSIDHINRITLPQIDRAARSFDSTMGSVGQLVESLDDQPQALLLGPGKIKPGPGEPGFESPQ